MSKIKIEVSDRTDVDFFKFILDGIPLTMNGTSRQIEVPAGDHTLTLLMSGEAGGTMKVVISQDGKELVSRTVEIPPGEHGTYDRYAVVVA